MYDDAMKLLAEDDLTAVLSVVGVDGRGTEPIATELPGSATRADCSPRPARASSTSSSSRMSHQTWTCGCSTTACGCADATAGFPSAIRARPHRGGGARPLCRPRAGPTCSWSVVRLSDLDPAGLLATPTTAPLAPLACKNGAPHPQRPVGNNCRRLSGASVNANREPGAPGCLPRDRTDPPRRDFCGAGGLPGSSSRDGGLEELPEFRDSRCSTRASFAASASFASCNSANWCACAAICRSCSASRCAWPATTTSNSSRGISSRAGTRRSNRSRANHPISDTPEPMTRPNTP